MSRIAVGYVLEEFLEFMAENATDTRYDSLADYIDLFLWDRLGAIGCWGNFEIFLKGISLIVDAWHRDPKILDFRGDSVEGLAPFERRVASVFGNDNQLHAIFDKNNFTAAMFNWQFLSRQK